MTSLAKISFTNLGKKVSYFLIRNKYILSTYVLLSKIIWYNKEVKKIPGTMHIVQSGFEEIKFSFLTLKVVLPYQW